MDCCFRLHVSKVERPAPAAREARAPHDRTALGGVDKCCPSRRCHPSRVGLSSPEEVSVCHSGAELITHSSQGPPEPSRPCPAVLPHRSLLQPHCPSGSLHAGTMTPPPSPNPPLSLCHRAPDKPRGLRGVCAVKQTPCGALAPVGLLPRGMASTCRTPLAEARSCLEALHGLCSLLQGRASVARPGSGPHHAVTSALPQ